jgi:hypothetical protein
MSDYLKRPTYFLNFYKIRKPIAFTNSSNFMKKILILLIYIAFKMPLMAQTDIKTDSISQPNLKNKKKTEKAAPLYRHEVGVETGAVLAQVFRLFGLVKDTQTFPTSPYLAFYKFRSKGQNYFRFGAGLTYNKYKEQLGAFADSRTVTRKSIDFRLGYESQIPIEDKWTLVIGGDATWGRSGINKVFDSGFDKAVRVLKTQSAGAALMVGLRYNFTSRISLGSEMSLGFVQSKTTEKDDFTTNPQFNKVIKTSEEGGAKFYGPANVYLSYRF